MSVVGLIVYAVLNASVPKLPPLNQIHLQTPLRIYTQNHILIASFGDKRRSPVVFEQIPQPLINAIISVEDARFYTHPGVDWIALFRAAQAVLSSGKKVQGASTITMQVARNFFLSREKSYWRKIKEVLLALQINQQFTKKEILTLYLNKIYFGNRAYGISAAAKTYYNKSISDLNLAQIAMLAGLPQAPSLNNPVNHSQAALKRRNHVLARMLEEKYIDRQAYYEAVHCPITAKYAYKEDFLHAPGVAEMVRQAMLSQYGESAYTRGLSVFTTIDAGLQRAANKMLKKGLLTYTLRHTYRGPEGHRILAETVVPEDIAFLKQQVSPYPGVLEPALVWQVFDRSVQVLLAEGEVITLPWEAVSWATQQKTDQAAVRKLDGFLRKGDQIWLMQKKGQYFLAQVPAVQGALVSMDPHTGALLALSGSSGFNNNQFNRAVQAERQTGSLFKPFVYAAGLSKGFTLASVINDAPVVLEDSGENTLWRPHNDSLLFYGPTRLRQGLVLSRNLVSIRLLQSTGIEYTLAYLQAFGFNRANLPHTLALALGAASVSPLDITTAYAVLARGGGALQKPYFIKEISDGQTHTVIHPALSVSSDLPYVVTPQVAFLVNDMLQDVIHHGTGKRARALHRRDIAGKTGTTNNQIDAWFSGYNQDVVTTVWVGFDDNSSLEEYGSQVALPIWIDYMQVALQKYPVKPVDLPSGIVQVGIDPQTGLRSVSEDSGDTICEYFRAENVPPEKNMRLETEKSMTALFDGAN